LGEDVGEAAVGHGGADVGGVARPIEEVGVDVEGDCGACVAEDAADLADVEAQVDDEVAGEGVAEVVEAKRRPAASVEAGALDRVGEGGAGDVSLRERGAVPGGEDVVVIGGEAGAASFPGEDGGELRGERDVADGGARLGCDPPGGGSQVRPRELGADADDAGLEVDVGPGEASNSERRLPV
jgi:hypothetical protein